MMLMHRRYLHGHTLYAQAIVQTLLYSNLIVLATEISLAPKKTLHHFGAWSSAIKGNSETIPIDFNGSKFKPFFASIKLLARTLGISSAIFLLSRSCRWYDKDSTLLCRRLHV